MESSSDAENVEGRSGVIQGQLGVSSRSPGVIQGKMANHCCMDMILIIGYSSTNIFLMGRHFQLI